MPKAKTSASLDGTGLSRPNLVERSSGAMKDSVPSSSLDILAKMGVTRVKPKSESMARGGVESETRIFDWEHG